MKKIYNKKEINKALDISVNIRGGGRMDLKPLASVAESIEGDGLFNKGFQGGQTINLHYLPISKEQENNQIDIAVDFLKTQYSVEYTAYAHGSVFELSDIVTQEAKDTFQVGEVIKNVAFYPAYISDRDEFMDPDYPNQYMSDIVELHEIVVTTNSGFYICKVSNKRLVCLLQILDNNTGDNSQLGEQPSSNSRYTKAGLYGIFVIYDIKVDDYIKNK